MNHRNAPSLAGPTKQLDPVILTMEAKEAPVPKFRVWDDPRYIANHQIDEETGFLVNPGFADAFDATRKLAFIQALRANDFKFTKTCQELGVSSHTIIKHRRIDKVFDDKIKEAIQDYADSLEWFSRSQAFEPRATLERIFQLRALKPEIYARDVNRNTPQSINITVTGDMVFGTNKRIDLMDSSATSQEYFPTTAQSAEQVPDSPTERNSSTELNPADRT